VAAGGLDVRIDGEVAEARSVRRVARAGGAAPHHAHALRGGARLRAPRTRGAVTFEYRYRRLGKGRADVAAPRLELAVRVPLRLDAPLPPEALHPVRVQRTAGHDATTVAVLGATSTTRRS
jgi:hypothetical protein